MGVLDCGGCGCEGAVRVYFEAGLVIGGCAVAVGADICEGVDGAATRSKADAGAVAGDGDSTTAAVTGI